ncbi:MAG: tripartite tricarboxylate transporter substrate binding protein [Burkholderiales bacterium]|nr:tripartite tricarboxylate transporter substrate binding protein [Burkholderiales bacterium]
MKRRDLLGAASAALALPRLQCALAQQRYPARPVSLFVMTTPGGTADLSMRAVADLAQAKLGTPVVVENRPGAGSALGLTQLARAERDGHTLGQITNSPITVLPRLQKVEYDPHTSFTYIAQYLMLFTPVSVKADSAFKTFQEMTDFGRKNPGKLRWSVALPRGGAHIATEAALRQLGVQSTFVPLKGAAEALTALLAGDLEFIAVSSYGPALASGQIRLLAECGTQKIPHMPQVPTFRELGFPFAQTVAFGFGGPAGLPASVAHLWESLLREIVAMPAFVERARKFNATPAFLSGAEFGATMRQDFDALGKLLPQLGFKTQ